ASLYIRDTYEYRIDIYGKKKEGTPLYSTVVTGGAGKNPIDIPLDFVKGNELLKVYITVTNEAGEHTNYWRIFVYSDTGSDVRIPEDIVIHNRADYERALSKGGKFLLLPEFYGEENTVKSSFIPVFWSPVHFPTEDPLGFIVDEDSDVLKGFPTEKYADYQWKSPVENSRSVRLKDVPGDSKVLFEFVPNFADNEPKSPLFILKEGHSEFLYCGFDLEGNDPASKALSQSISDYLFH
nr:hypothetical protein [Lachnospiraceae bacterium]